MVQGISTKQSPQTRSAAPYAKVIRIARVRPAFRFRQNPVTHVT